MDRLEACLARADTKYGSLLVLRKTPKYARNFAQHCSQLRYEPPVVKELETLDYDVFIDVGAGFGYHSIIASHFADKVVAFEPHPLRYGIAKFNIKEFDNIELFDDLVGTESNEITIGLRAMGSVGNKRENRKFSLRENTETTSVPLEVLFNMFSDEQLLVKIDVEGNELDVLDSAGDLGQYKDRVVWFVERHPWNVEVSDLMDRFEPAGYNSKLIFGEQKAKHITEIYKFWSE